MSSQAMAGKGRQGPAGRLNPTSLHYTFYSEEGEQKRTYFRFHVHRLFRGRPDLPRALDLRLGCLYRSSIAAPQQTPLRSGYSDSQS
ncbi:hypothetical protein V496_10419 [Pseudogymnoascus sp. VKM F-4515 (FW-2607)]|nr:hypothetical protein V496_10419 [Pseudogymnoascus sp. VKM F-4515 (FW-2607)]